MNYGKMLSYEKQHQAKIREGLAECTVLLKTNGDFPLEKPCPIAAYGRGVRNTVKGGTGSGEVNSRYFTTVEQGLINAGFEITTGSWLDKYDRTYAEKRARFVKQVKAEAKSSGKNIAMFVMGRTMPEPEYNLPLNGEGDTAIYVVARICGEGADRANAPGDAELSESEIRDILAANERYKKFMLVLNVGSPVDLTPVSTVDNILVLSQLGPDTGDVLADILLGRENPSGKLTTTWATAGDYCKDAEFGCLDDTHYYEGIYVGYRYFDSFGKTPLYPFGFGLSYTSFKSDVTSVEAAGSVITAHAIVKNTGNWPGKETLQLYASAPAGRLDKPYQQLVAFGKTKKLAPGESAELSISFNLRDCASYDEESASFLLEKGSYILRCGASSRSTVAAAQIILDDDVQVKKVRPAFGKPDFTDLRSSAANAQEKAPVTINIKSTDIACETVQYDKPVEISSQVKGLSDEELILASIGAFNPKGSIQSMVGSAGTTVAGSAGETTSALKDKGLPCATMADGPAGLRLSREFYRDEKGAHGIGTLGMPETIAEFLPKYIQILAKLLAGGGKPPKGAKVEYQYCSMIPIGTALAQSWNTDYAETCGDIIGTEMEMFRINYWLAPALNIHRSILCGRNFEYYSEDPVISGKFAAAITCGVRKHKACAVTLKHYAANNQEYNRLGNNSVVSERAMREIYLKGFEIAIREGNAGSIMTSYNLINGTHSDERRDLCEDILRAEFGFDGLVMTDWVIAGDSMADPKAANRAPRAQHVAAAGGNVFMPGSKYDYENMKKGLADGNLTRQQLEINVQRTYDAINALLK